MLQSPVLITVVNVLYSGEAVPVWGKRHTCKRHFYSSDSFTVVLTPLTPIPPKITPVTKIF